MGKSGIDFEAFAIVVSKEIDVLGFVVDGFPEMGLDGTFAIDEGDEVGIPLALGDQTLS